MPAKMSVKRGGANLQKAVDLLAKSRVLVGIPADKASRKSDSINNAQLLAIHTFGSPARGIPARPVLQPAIQNAENKRKIVREMEAAAAAAFQGKADEVEKRLERTGIAGQNAAQGWFTNSVNHWAPDQPETIARKLDKLQGVERAKAFAKLDRGTPADIAAINTTLVDTGAMRGAITYVVEMAGRAPSEAPAAPAEAPPLAQTEEV